MSSEVDPKGLNRRGPDFAFPMDDAPKDGTILRLLVKFDRKSSAGPFEDTDEPSWTIGANNEANTGEDQWDVVGWSWEQDVFCSAYGTKVLGWLPFHAENSVSAALPSPASPSIGRVGVDLIQEAAAFRETLNAAPVLDPYEGRRRLMLQGSKLLHTILDAADNPSTLVSHEEPAGDTQGALPVTDETQPAIWVSAAQLAEHVDPDPRDGSEGGNYLPARKTRRGLFQTPLYTHPAALVSPPDNGEAVAWACKTCNSPRSVDPCPKCGTPLTKPADGWEWPALPDIDRIRALAREVGYAIGVHGSLERDLDLIAAPWVESAIGPYGLALHIAQGLGGEVVDFKNQDKPCGRWSCNIHTPDWTKLIDLSVMPPALQSHNEGSAGK